MQIRYKLFLFLTFFLFLLMISLITNYYTNKRSENLYIKNQTLKFAETTQNLMNLNNEAIKTMVYDYSYWDELRDYTLKPDTAFTALNMKTLTEYDYIDYVWIYDINGNLLYNTKKTNINLLINPVKSTTIAKLFDTSENSVRRMASFYLKQNNHIYAIYGCTIHATRDKKRQHKPTGFLFLGKAIDKNYIRQLEKTTNSEVQLIYDSLFVKKQAKDYISSVVNFSDFNNNYVCSLVFSKYDNFIADNRTNRKQILYLVFIIIVFTIIFSIYFFNKIVTNPFRLIVQSLNTGKTEYLNPFFGKKNEFGTISRLIRDFFEQKAILENEINERKKAQETLLKLSVAVEQSANVVVITNIRGIIEYVNPKIEELSGYTPFEIIGKPVSIFKSGYSSPQFYNNLWKTILSGNVWQGEFYNKRKNGDLYWDATTITPIKNQNNEITYFIAVKEDITSRINAQKALIANKKIIEAKNKNILDSIKYASKIQRALLPNREVISKYLDDFFVLYIPKDIVSGDFYYINRIKNTTIIAAMDCTGHGVPGAFMGMLGSALLNEIILNKQCTEAALILDELRIQIKRALQQTGQSMEPQDGMEGALCSVNTDTLEMSFAGACQPLWIFRQNSTVSGIDFIQIEGDSQPVGIYPNEKSFTQHKINLIPGDTFYIFSDGFSSQLNFESRKTFKTKNLKELLYSINNQSMKEQKKILLNALAQWKGNREQTDDILVIGVKM